MLDKQEIISLNQLEGAGERPVRLTRNSQNKVVKVEIYVNKEQRCEIFKYFPDKTISLKEGAPHFLLLRSLAAYGKKKLVNGDSVKDEAKQASISELVRLTKILCHKTAPLYNLINHSYFNNPFHPAKEAWEEFCEQEQNFNLNQNQLKIAFLKAELSKYKNLVDSVVQQSPLANTKPMQKFLQSHHKKTQKFIDQLNRLEQVSLSEEQVRKLLSNQDEIDSLGIRSLGSFLRSQAHQLAEDALSAVDDITDARFDQLFSFSAHPLHRRLAAVKKAIGDLQSTQMVRFLNTRSPVPAGQLAVIQGNDSINIDNDAPSEKRWMDIMPYVASSAFVGDSIGHEGRDDIAQILAVYANGAEPIKKTSSLFYQALMGKKGPLATVGIIFLGLPAIVVGVAGLIIGACLAMAVDFIGFLLQAAMFLLFSPIILFGIIVDFCMQIPSFFTEKAEHKFSCLAMMMEWPIPPQWFSEPLRTFSLVRIFKQFLLDGFNSKFEIFKARYYNPVGACSDTLDIETKDACLNLIMENQAEGLLNVVANKFFSFRVIAGFLHEKLKQFFYAVREFRKVISITAESAYYFFTGKTRQEIQQWQRGELIKKLLKKIDDKNDEIFAAFRDGIKKAILLSKDSNKEQESLIIAESTHKPEKTLAMGYQKIWAPVTPWSSKQLENPLDFISDIARGAVETVDFAFTEDPGIATPMFALAMLCFGALLVPSVASVMPAQLVNGLQWLPQSIAKAFMGKSLKVGTSDIVFNILSNFLQWQLMTYSAKATAEIAHGNFEWVKKLFEYPEEITLSAATFISIGYAVGFIPNLPTGTNIFPPSYPFLNALTDYPIKIYNGFTNFGMVIINESREAASHGAFGLNTLELAFIGLKLSLFIYGLLSGTSDTSFTPLNIEKLCQDYRQAEKEEKRDVILELLRQHGINDPDSTLAEKITKEFSQLEPEPTIPIEKTLEEKAFVKARKKVKRLLKSIRDMEVLGIPIDLDLDQNVSNANYQSKYHAELVYDELFFAIENYNQSARRIGLFHEQIDGTQFLHNFYNKHCYAGSSGWHKILFGILLFPVTWLWRGFKYLIGTPSMRQQVKKSFCKDFAMLFQLIPDVIAPILRSFLKAAMYSVRMILGIFVLPFLIGAVVINLFIFTFGLIGTLLASIYAIDKGIQNDGAITFAETMRRYFSGVKALTDNVWDNLLCNWFINDYLKFISFVGGSSGTGSPHRLNLLKKIGAASLYEYLTSVADTSFDNLQLSACQLSAKLATDSELLLIEKNGNETTRQILDTLAEYSDEAEKRWKPVSSERPRQLADLSESLLKPEGRGQSNISSIFAVLQSDSDSELNKKLTEKKIFSL